MVFVISWCTPISTTTKNKKQQKHQLELFYIDINFNVLLKFISCNTDKTKNFSKLHTDEVIERVKKRKNITFIGYNGH